MFPFARTVSRVLKFLRKRLKNCNSGAFLFINLDLTISGFTSEDVARDSDHERAEVLSVLAAKGYGQRKRLNHLEKFLQIKKKNKKPDDENATGRSKLIPGLTDNRLIAKKILFAGLG